MNLDIISHLAFTTAYRIIVLFLIKIFLNNSRIIALKHSRLYFIGHSKKIFNSSQFFYFITNNRPLVLVQMY